MIKEKRNVTTLAKKRKKILIISLSRDSFLLAFKEKGDDKSVLISSL
jgi:hypothetical protein